MIINKKIIYIILLNILFIFGIYLFLNNYYKNRYFFQEIREKGNYKFINPILECNTNFKFYNTNNIENKINNFIQNNKNKFSDISYYFRDLNNGSTLGYNENSEFVPASLLKIPVAISYFKEKEKGNINLIDTKIYMDKIDFNVQKRFFGNDTIKIGETYSVYTLIEKMLIYSDNIAANMLFYNIGNDVIKGIYKDLGLDFLDLESSSLRVSTKKYSSFFRILYNSSYLNREDSELILNILSKNDFDLGLKKFLPKNIVVANKYGERSYEDTGEKQLHDCGIVYFPNKPYILCVMTKGKKFDNLTYLIQNISKIVYDDISTK